MNDIDYQVRAVPSIGTVLLGGAPLQPGMRGESVREAQRELVRTGYLTQEQMRMGPGIFGPATLAAVKEFQGNHHSTPVGDTTGGIDRATLQLLYKARTASPSKSHPMSASMGSLSTFKSIPLDDYLSDKKGSAALAAIVIGNAEGTRTPDGGKTKGFEGYQDPVSRRTHKGSFSYQTALNRSAEEADRRQLAAMRAVKDRYLSAAKKAGLDPGNALLAAAYFDGFNQSPAAAERFLSQLPSLKARGITPESIIQARVSSWVDSRTRKRYVTASGMPGGGEFVSIARKRAERERRAYLGEPDVIRIIREDQARRVQAMVLALKMQGLFLAPANVWVPAALTANSGNVGQRLASVGAQAHSAPRVSSDGGKSIFESIWEWLWGTLQGDFNKNASVSQITVNTVLGLIPLVDQVLDLRDIIAGLKDIIEFYMEDKVAQSRHQSVLGVPYEVWIWLNVFIIAIGCIPEVGSLVKGVLRALVESLVALTKKAGGLQAKHLQEIWEQLLHVLGRLGVNQAKATAWLKQLPDKLNDWMTEATGKIKSALDAIQGLLSQTEDMVLSRYAGWVLNNKTVQQLTDSVQKIKKAVQQAYTRLDKMKVEVNTWLREQIGKVLGARPPDARSAGELSDALRASRAAAAQAEASYQAAVAEFRKALRVASGTLYSGVDPILLLKMVKVGYASAKKGIKKFDVFRREQQLRELANRIDFAKMSPAQLDELEAAFARGVDDEVAEAAENSFSGKLKANQVELAGVYTKRIKYTKRSRKSYEALRSRFDSSIRQKFAKSLARDTELVAQLKKAGLTNSDIARLKDGGIPPGYQVHHKIPIDDGGDNSFSNLVLIKNDPYHKVITNTANDMTKGLKPGQTITVEYPIVPGVIYPP